MQHLFWFVNPFFEFFLIFFIKISYYIAIWCKNSPFLYTLTITFKFMNKYAEYVEYLCINIQKLKALRLSKPLSDYIFKLLLTALFTSSGVLNSGTIT